MNSSRGRQRGRPSARSGGACSTRGSSGRSPCLRPIDMANRTNVTIGVNEYHGKVKPIKFGGADRLRHMYMIVKTGGGKATGSQNMCLDDIRNGHGACFIDPHCESIDWLRERMPEN